MCMCMCSISLSHTIRPCGLWPKPFSAFRLRSSLVASALAMGNVLACPVHEWDAYAVHCRLLVCISINPEHRGHPIVNNCSVSSPSCALVAHVVVIAVHEALAGTSLEGERDANWDPRYLQAYKVDGFSKRHPVEMLSKLWDVFGPPPQKACQLFIQRRGYDVSVEPPVEGMVRCAVCGLYGARKLCSICRGIRYCSAECQHTDWCRHKHECRLSKYSSQPFEL